METCAVCGEEMDLVATEQTVGELYDKLRKPTTRFDFLCYTCFSYTVQIYENGVELIAVVSGNLKR